MKTKILSYFGISIALAALTACGGGGGGGGTPPPVTSTQTFQINTAIANNFNATGTRSFTVSGTSSGVAITGTGTVTSGSVTSMTFEGIAALQKSQSISMSLTGNGVTIPITANSTSYVDTNYVPLGSLTPSEYEVVIIDISLNHDNR